MSVYNLLEYSLNYSDMTGSLWFYSKDQTTNFNNSIENAESLKAKLLRSTVAQPVPNQP